MQAAIKILSIVTIVWTSLALVNCLFLIYILSDLLLNNYSFESEKYFLFFGAFGLAQIFGIIILLSFLISFSALDKTKQLINIE